MMPASSNSCIPYVSCMCGALREMPIAQCGRPPVGTQAACPECPRTWTLTDEYAGEDRWMWTAEDRTTTERPSAAEGEGIS
jgi:hypothetical protein